YVPSREGNGGGTLETRDDTNLAMSVGGGLRWVPGGAGSLFLDAHYDFYFVPGFDTPVIPVRVGISHP
ncbi:MAG TPA: hypothetical protein VEY91_09080, partial [Candidatus Limnocylindria bacterium]|nr:hypothetical protein [Candidatus Limnocylindria bacterium]